MKAALLSWYETNGRDLPWRKTNDPYAILVSEVMLQQTWVTSPDPVQ
jgi:A/G-specific adenine glycosylase